MHSEGVGCDIRGKEPAAQGLPEMQGGRGPHLAVGAETPGQAPLVTWDGPSVSLACLRRVNGLWGLGRPWSGGDGWDLS